MRNPKLPVRVDGGREHAALSLNVMMMQLMNDGRCGGADLVEALLDNAAFGIALIAVAGREGDLATQMVGTLRARVEAHVGSDIVEHMRKLMFPSAGAAVN